ncbi:MAG: hypothetical protein RLZZ598_1118 [Pseudomonadota bacterium]
MKTRTRLLVLAIAGAVLSVHFWMLTRVGTKATASAPAARPAATLDLLAAPAEVGAPAPAPTPAPMPPPTPSTAKTPPAPAPGRLPRVAAVPALHLSARPDAPADAFLRTAAAEPLSAPEMAAAPVAITTPSPRTAESEPMPPPPVYPTRMPPAATINYRLSRGGISGSGSLVWRPEAQSYNLRLEGRVPIFGTLITQNSRGNIDASGLAPLRFTDRRLRRSEQAANFQRTEDGSGEITFSGSTNAVPLHRGTQDRLSVMVQLAAIAKAWSRPPAIGEHLMVHVVGVRGDQAHWSLRYEGIDPVRIESGETIQALRFLREPDSPHDTRAEFWLHPGQHHLPLKARLSDGNSDPFELLWQSAD